MKKLAKLNDLLESDRMYQPIASYLGDLQTSDRTWKFALVLLKLLRLLKATTEKELCAYEEKIKQLEKERGQKSATAPPMSPDTLSFSQQKWITAALQFIACLGVSPCLLPGVGLPIESRSQTIGRLTDVKVELPRETRDRRLLHCVAVLLDVAKLQTLATIILSRHLGDLLAMLCQLAYAPLPRPKNPAEVNQNSKPETVTDTELFTWQEPCESLTLPCRQWARQQLRHLVDSSQQPALIRELLVLQGAQPVSGPSKVLAEMF